VGETLVWEVELNRMHIVYASAKGACNLYFEEVGCVAPNADRSSGRILHHLFF
jgi:hypothetical protein